MLDTLDILIGFTVVMLIVSMPVTILTQALVELFNLRGKALKQGVIALLGILDPALKDKAKAVANDLLTHELVARRSLTGSARLAGTVHREELTKLILNYATDDKAKNAGSNEALVKTALTTLGIDDPAEVLKAVRGAQLELEKVAPELASDVRVNMAILTHASSDFLARINGWFDQSMDRVSELFTLYSRVVTAIVALAVAIVLQLDSVSLINRLAADKKVRDVLVEAAVKDPGRFDPQPAPATALTDAKQRAEAATEKLEAATAAAAEAQPKGSVDPALAVAIADARTEDETAQLRLRVATARMAAAEAAAAVTAAKVALDKAPGDAAARTAYDAAVKVAAEQKAAADAQANAPQTVAALLRDDEGVADLVNLRLVEIPQSWGDWLARAEKPGWLQRIFGILLTAGLLSLGGPFWYALLQNLLKFRPTIARKDDEQRELRQTTQTGGAAAPTAAASALVVGGERGNLDAVG